MPNYVSRELNNVCTQAGVATTGVVTYTFKLNGTAFATVAADTTLADIGFTLVGTRT
jgi:hypothetical protein